MGREALHRDAGQHKAEEKETARAGFSGSPTTLPYRQEMERSFGVSFADVKVYSDAQAQEASSALDAKAYTLGSEIAFGSPNPPKQIVAHELAHVVQQRGGALGEVQRWGGSEHYAVGNLAGNLAIDEFKAKYHLGAPAETSEYDVDVLKPRKMTFDKKKTLVMPPDGTPLVPVEGFSFFAGLPTPGQALTAGAYNRYGGDYAVTPDELGAQKHERKYAFGGFQPTLVVPNIYAAVINANEAQLIIAATTNANHFYPLHRLEWQVHHERAIDAARGKDLPRAWREEGFATHFLQDCWAAGHMMPRMLDNPTRYFPDGKGSPDSNAATEKELPLALSRSKKWHDFFNMLPAGLPTNKGRFHGDYYMDTTDATVMAGATKDSMLAVLATSMGQHGDAGRYTAQVTAAIPTPDIAGINADPFAGPAWRRMTGDYRESLKQARDNLAGNPGAKAQTYSGISYDAADVLRRLEDNIFKPTAPYSGASLTSLRDTLVNIYLYLQRSHDANIYTHLDDDLVKVKSHTPRWDPAELETRFGLFTQLVEAASAVLKSQKEAANDNPPRATTDAVVLADEVLRGVAVAKGIALSADVKSALPSALNDIARGGDKHITELPGGLGPGSRGYAEEARKKLTKDIMDLFVRCGPLREPPPRPPGSGVLLDPAQPQNWVLRKAEHDQSCDPYERQADAVAERITRGLPVQELLATVPPGVQRASKESQSVTLSDDALRTAKEKNEEIIRTGKFGMSRFGGKGDSFIRLVFVQRALGCGVTLRATDLFCRNLAAWQRENKLATDGILTERAAGELVAKGRGSAPKNAAEGDAEDAADREAILVEEKATAGRVGKARMEKKPASGVRAQIIALAQSQVGAVAAVDRGDKHKHGGERLRRYYEVAFGDDDFWKKQDKNDQGRSANWNDFAFKREGDVIKDGKVEHSNNAIGIGAWSWCGIFQVWAVKSAIGRGGWGGGQPTDMTEVRQDRVSAEDKKKFKEESWPPEYLHGFGALEPGDIMNMNNDANHFCMLAAAPNSDGTLVTIDANTDAQSIQYNEGRWKISQVKRFFQPKI